MTQDRMIAAGVAGILALLCVADRATSQGVPERLDSYLVRMGLDAQQRASVIEGKALVKLLPSRNERDVAVLGITRLQASRSAAMTHFGNPERSLGGSARKSHAFSEPPADRDVSLAAFDASEYRDLRECKPGRCDFKLPAAAMTTLIGGIDWSAADAKARADERMRNALLRLAIDYTARGNRAILAYDDTRGARSGEVFDELVAQSPEFYDYAPELERYLDAFPTGRLNGAHDVLYWTEDRVPRLRPTLALNHMVLYTPRPDAGRSFVARKQIYASHYFEGAFELMAIVDAAAPGPGAFIVIVRRFRLDNLPSGVGNLRGRIQSGLVDATRRDLEHYRSSIEASVK